jgi:DNA-binding NarL/FixJ family response regulator
MFDALVMAYRSHPPLLQALVKSLDDVSELKGVLLRASDWELAREVGINLEIRDQGFDQRIGSLTPRETEILQLLSEGLSNSEIARRLFISESTAKVHVHNVLRKTGSRNRLQAALLARDLQSECDQHVAQAALASTSPASSG